MTTYLGKSCSFGLPRVPFVNCRRFMYLVISLLVYRAGCGIWLYQFLIIAYLFTLRGHSAFLICKKSLWQIISFFLSISFFHSFMHSFFLSFFLITSAFNFHKKYLSVSPAASPVRFAWYQLILWNISSCFFIVLCFCTTINDILHTI